MASLRSSSRLLPRLTSTITRTSKPTSSLPLLYRPLLTPFHTSHYHTTPPLHRDTPPSSSSSSSPSSSSTSPTPSTIYTFTDIQSLTTTPNPTRILIDVREPGELRSTGHIPTAKNIPVSTAPDSFFLSPEEFEDRYGWERPTKDVEVIFYCKAGVRSRAAAKLAEQAGFGGRVGEFPGSWVEWVEKGGKVERGE